MEYSSEKPGANLSQHSPAASQLEEFKQVNLIPLKTGNSTSSSHAKHPVPVQK